MRNLIFVGITALAAVSCGSVGNEPSADQLPSASATPTRDSTAAGVAPVDPIVARKQFIARVLGDTEDVWAAVFEAKRLPPYPRPVLVLYRGSVSSACGPVTGKVHPRYCPRDYRMYFDLADIDVSIPPNVPGGDFALALLVAHEVGHHVQTVLGTASQSEGTQSSADERMRENLRVRIELRADCFAGVWSHAANKRGMLEAEDLEKGVPLALGTGDPSKQGEAGQRTTWFKRGHETGDPADCDISEVSKR